MERRRLKKTEDGLS